MFITNMLLTDVLYEFFVIMAPNFSGPMPRPLNWDEHDLHCVMQQWYVFEAHAEHEISLRVTPADFSEEGSEDEENASLSFISRADVSEEGSEDNRIPFDDMTWEYFNGNNMGWW